MSEACRCAASSPVPEEAMPGEVDWLKEQMSEYRRPLLAERRGIEARLGVTPNRPLRAIIGSPRPEEEAVVARWYELNREMAVIEKPEWQIGRLKEYRETKKGNRD